MGDRCFLIITIRKEDAERAVEAAYQLEPSDLDIMQRQGGQVEMEEVNYGGETMLEELKDAGVMFYGYHSSGYDYPACEFYCSGEGPLESFEVYDGRPMLLASKNESGRWFIDPEWIEKMNVFQDNLTTFTKAVNDSWADLDSGRPLSDPT